MKTFLYLHDKERELGLQTALEAQHQHRMTTKPNSATLTKFNEEYFNTHVVCLRPCATPKLIIHNGFYDIPDVHDITVRSTQMVPPQVLRKYHESVMPVRIVFQPSKQEPCASPNVHNTAIQSAKMIPTQVLRKYRTPRC